MNKQQSILILASTPFSPFKQKPYPPLLATPNTYKPPQTHRNSPFPHPQKDIRTSFSSLLLSFSFLLRFLHSPFTTIFILALSSLTVEFFSLISCFFFFWFWILLPPISQPLLSFLQIYRLSFDTSHPSPSIYLHPYSFPWSRYTQRIYKKHLQTKKPPLFSILCMSPKRIAGWMGICF